MTSLQGLFAAIDQAENQHQLRSQVAPEIGEYFAAQRSKRNSGLQKIL